MCDTAAQRWRDVCVSKVARTTRGPHGASKRLVSNSLESENENQGDFWLKFERVGVVGLWLGCAPT